MHATFIVNDNATIHNDNSKNNNNNNISLYVFIATQ